MAEPYGVIGLTEGITIEMCKGAWLPLDTPPPLLDINAVTADLSIIFMN